MGFGLCEQYLQMVNEHPFARFRERDKTLLRVIGADAANAMHFVFDAETVVVHMQIQGIGRHDHRPVCPGIDEERYVAADVEAGDD